MTVEVPKFIDENEIEEYVPHRGKMLLLSRITDYDLDRRIVTCEYDITENCIFYDKEGSGIPSWVGFELMAQTICTLTGIAHKLLGTEVLPGMILSVTNFKTKTDWLKCGTTVRIKMTEDYRDDEDSLYNYSGELWTSDGGGEPAVTAKISVIEIESFEKLNEIRGRYVE